MTGLRAIFEQGKIDLDILTIFKFFLKEELSIGKVIGFVILKLIELFFGGRVKILQKLTVEIADSKTEHNQPWAIAKDIQTAQRYHDDYSDKEQSGELEENLMTIGEKVLL